MGVFTLYGVAYREFLARLRDPRLARSISDSSP